MKKSIIIVIAALVVIGAVVAGFLFWPKDNIEYQTFLSETYEFAVKAGFPKDSKFVFEPNKEFSNRGDFTNEEDEYNINFNITQNLKSTYDNNHERHKEKEEYEEYNFKNAKGHGYASTSFSRKIELILEETEKGYRIATISISKTKGFSEGLGDIMESEEVKAFLNSIQLTEYVEPEEKIEEKEDEKVEVKEEEKEEMKEDKEE